MTGTKLSGRQIMQLFYTEINRSQSIKGHEGEESGLFPTVFRCKCGKTRAQKLKYGYTNLVQHVLVKHSDWIAAATQETYAIPSPAITNTSGKYVGTTKRGKVKKQIETTIAINETNDIIEKKTILDRKDDEENVPETHVTMTAKQTTPSSIVQKRSDCLSWDDYFMSVAFLSAMRSKDPSTQVGACDLYIQCDSIVDPERKIAGIGYNGFPNRCGDDELPWTRESKTNSPLDTKYPYVCHAEMNAILNKNSTDVKGCTIYVGLFPCNECAKLIIQSGISRVVYGSDKYKQDWQFVASRRLLDMAGVQLTRHRLQRSKIVIDFTSIR